MRKGFGFCCIALGICCLLASAGLILHNHAEEENAGHAAMSILQEVRENIPDPTGTELPGETLPQMPAAQVSGYDCIGILSIPVLELELPVLADWSYAKLKVAPCHYFGSCYEKNFVIAAHNYQSHFGRLPQLQPEDIVLFTDLRGTTYCYEVVLLETLPGHATEEMITSGFDLSLYTCTPGGASRVTVRCSAIEP